MEEAVDHFEEGEQGAGQDDCYDEVTRPKLTSSAPQEERDAEWDRGQGVTPVVDDIGEQCHAVAEQEDRELNHRRDQENGQAEADCLDSRSGSDDRGIYEAVRVVVVSVFVVVVEAAGGVGIGLFGAH